MLDVITNDILASPPILIGLFACIGLISQRAAAPTVISGTLKTVMSFIVITAGATLIQTTLNHFTHMFEYTFKVRGLIPNNEAVVATAQIQFGSETALIMIFGMLMNIIFARYTPFKYIFLTGHHILYMSCLVAVALSSTGIHHIFVILIGATILGALMVLSPALLQPTVRKITGSDDFAIGHFGSFGYFVAAQLGRVFGNPKKSTEHKKVSQSLGFLRDTSVSLSLTMLVFFLILSLFTGPEYVETNLSDGMNYIVFSFLEAIKFAAGVYIILAGVRLLLAEIVPAFKGIADKFVPNAKPALDCPTIFPFATNAVMIGFFFSFISGVVSMFILPFFGLAFIVPGLVPHFFTGATAGVFGNATGGQTGAIIGAIVNGFLITLLPAILLIFLGDLGFVGTTFGDSDFNIVGSLIIGIMRLFGFYN